MRHLGSAALVGVPLLVGGAALGPARLQAAHRSNASAAYRVVAKAVKKTASAKSAKIAFTARVTAVGSSGSSATSRTSGSTSKTITLHGSGTVKGFGSTGEGELVITGGGVGTIHERMIVPNLYIKLPPADRRNVPGHKPWIMINLNTLEKAKLGATLQQLAGSANTASGTLASLQDISKGGVSKVGTTTVRGVKTTAYKAAIDLSKLSTRGASPLLLQQAETELHLKTLPVEVWIDGKDRIRQFNLRLNATLKGASGSGGQKSAHVAESEQIDFFDYGTSVTVQAPRSSHVYNATAAVTKGTSASRS